MVLSFCSMAEETAEQLYPEPAELPEPTVYLTRPVPSLEDGLR
jgi:hypothetical protein